MANFVVVDYQAKTGQFVTDTQKAAREHKKAMKEMGDTAKEFAKIIGVAYGTVAIAEGIKEFIGRTVEMDIALSKLHEKTGLSAEAIGGLRLAATQSGVDMERFGQMATKVAGIQFDAAAGSKAARAEMAYFGIVAKDTADHAIDKVLKGFNQLPPSFDRAGLAVKIFGQRMGTDFLLIADKARGGLQGLEDDARKFGVQLSGDTLKAAEEFEKIGGLLSLQFHGIGETILKDALPEIEAFAKELNDPAIAQGFKDIATGAVTAFATVATWAAKGAHAVQGFGADLAASMHGAAVGDIDRQKAEIDRITGRLKTLDDMSKSRDPARLIFQGYYGTDPEAQTALAPHSFGLGFVNPSDEQGFLQKRLVQAQKDLALAKKQVAEAVVHSASPPGGDEGDKTIKALNKTFEDRKKDLDKLLAALNTGNGGGKGAGSDKVGEAFKQFAGYVTGLDAKAFDSGDQALDNYMQGLQSLNVQMHKFIDAGGSATVAAALFAKGDDALLKKRSDEWAKAAKLRQAEIDDYGASLKQQIADQQSSLALQIKAVGLGSHQADMAQEIFQIQSDGMRQVQELQRQMDTDRVDADKDKFKQEIELQKKFTADQIAIATKGAADLAKAEADGLNGARKALQDFQAQAKDTAAQVNSIVSNGLNGLVDSITNLLTTGKGGFKELGQQIEQSIVHMFVQSDIAKLTAPGGMLGGLFDKLGLGGADYGGDQVTALKDNTKALQAATAAYGSASAFNALGGSGGDMSWLTSIFSGGSGSASDASVGIIGAIQDMIPGFANGGNVAGNKPIVVGERGPELFVPNASGKIIPNNRLRTAKDGGHSTVNNFNIAVQPTSTRRTAEQVANETARKQRVASARNA